MESSSFGRLVGVLVSPGKTFRSIAERPTWAVALVVILLVIGVVWYLAGTRTDYQDVMTQTFEQRGRDVPPAQVEQQVEFRVRYSSAISDLTPLDRILYPAPAEGDEGDVVGNLIFNVVAVHEIGRREGLSIITTRHADWTTR